MKLFLSLAFAIGASAAPIWHAAAGLQLEKRADSTLEPRASACHNAPPKATVTTTPPASGQQHAAAAAAAAQGKTSNNEAANARTGANGANADATANGCSAAGPADASTEAATSSSDGNQEGSTGADSSAGITNPNAVNAQAHSHSQSTSHVIQTPDGPVVVSHASSNSYAHDANGDSAQSGSESTSIQGSGGSYTEEGSHENSRGGATATATANAVATTSATAAPTPT